MRGLAKCVVDLMVDEFGPGYVVKALSNPYWFQALSCVLAYDWHSSGTTTVTCGILKSVINPEAHGILVAGGKGKKSTGTVDEITRKGDRLSLSTRSLESLRFASRMCAKVDNAGVQDGYSLYHHALFASKGGEWAVIQQGLNARTKYARRYQWFSTPNLDFVADPHAAVAGSKGVADITNLVTAEGRENQAISTDLVKDSLPALKRQFELIRRGPRGTLDWWACPELRRAVDAPVPRILLPTRVNWDAIDLAAELQPRDYEELLSIKGMGPATLRGLALVSELVYGAPFSRRDPVKYSFAYGGKDGVPYPVNRPAMDESIQFLYQAVAESRLDQPEKKYAFRQLGTLAEAWDVVAYPTYQSMAVR